MNRSRLLVFASGGEKPESGGSGFENLVMASRDGRLNADIVGVVSNHANGGVRMRAHRLGIPFIHFTSPWNAERYQKIARDSDAHFFALSGWLQHVVGLDRTTRFSSKTVFNIHPGPLPEFGGNRMYGHHVHERVIGSFRRGERKNSAVSMHFVTEEYDSGPIFLHFPVTIDEFDTPETLAARVNGWEHRLQPTVTDMVVKRLIRWDGVNPSSLVVPPNLNRLLALGDAPSSR